MEGMQDAVSCICSVGGLVCWGGARKGEQIWQHHLFGAGKLQSSMDLSRMHWGLWEFRKREIGALEKVGEVRGCALIRV